MNRIQSRGLTLGVALVLAVSAGSKAADDGNVSLFNGKDLTGWRIFVDPKTKGYDPDSQPERIFKVEDGVIHVSGERFACLSTEKDYENYRLIVEFKWGEKRWAPRATAKRDSGILMHCVGPDKIWTKSIECQIQEGDVGDFHLVGGPTLSVDGKPLKGFGKKTADAEKPNGEWNTVEVVCDGDSITNIVNGVVVNKGTKASLTKGRITLQSEGAEVFYRKVELRPLKSEK
ncbi:MAG: DUF1080 domain-containing protein [Isosphaeraceae bacterium]